MPLDSNRIWTYEEADAGATMSDLLNLGQTATSARVADMQADIDARQPLLGDTGWIACLTNSGFAAHNSFPPQVRQIGNRVYIRGGWSSTGMTANAANGVGFVPLGFEPPAVSGSSASAYGSFWAPTPATVGTVRVYGDGLIELRTASAVPSSLIVMDGMSWAID